MPASQPPVSDQRIASARVAPQGGYTGRIQTEWALLLETMLNSVAADSDADALAARMQAVGYRPDVRMRFLMRNCIAGLKAAGLWAGLDCLYFLGVPNAAAALLNWRSANYSLTTFGTETFIPGQGYDGDGSTGHLNTQFNPTTATSPNFVQDSASLGVWVLEDVPENKDDIGNTNALLRTYIDYTANSAGYRLNTSSTSSVSAVAGARSSVGLTWASRTASTGFSYGRNGQVVGTITATSVAPSNDTFFLDGGRIADFSSERVAFAFIGRGFTNAEMAQLYAIVSPVVQALVGPDLYNLDLNTSAQTLDGLGFEIQSDSIESDAGGIQEGNTSSLLRDLSASELTRIATMVASVPGGNAFVDLRLAMGLYFRGITSDGKNFVERIAGDAAALNAFITASNVGGITFSYWSPAPYWKRVTVSGTTYNGGTTPVPNKATDPTGFNTYLRNMLQGGTLDAPDKTANPTGYAAWMDAFTNAIIADLVYVHTNIGRISRFSLQNEPGSSGSLNPAGYPQCNWTAQLMYDCLSVLVPKIRANATLSTYGGKANRIFIFMDSFNGQSGVGASLVKADATLLAQIDGWAWHMLTTTAADASYIRFASSFLNANTNGKPVFADENEYLDAFVTIGNAAYRPPADRFANLAMMPMNWFVWINSPIWYWLHIGKPTTALATELTGRSLTVWRPPGSATPAAPYASLAAGTWDYNPTNWNALKPYLRFMPKGSVRLSMPPVIPRSDTLAMATRKPNGKIVLWFVNRTEVDGRVRVNAPGLTGAFTRYRYDSLTPDQLIETVAVNGGVDLTVPPWSFEVLEQAA